MTTPLYSYLQQALGEASSTIIRVSEVEQIAGEDWLLEVAAQAEALKLQVMPHPVDVSLIVVERDLQA